jgi:homoserine dehydrogenase
MATSPTIDVFVELIGGESGVAQESVRAALRPARRGHGQQGSACGAWRGTRNPGRVERATLAFEAAVGGGIPIIKTLREALAGNGLTRLYGILNGTCNFILTRMEEGMSYGAALARAQELGYAEADPSFDVDGHDTAHKLAILTSVAFGSEIDRGSIFVEGISGIEPEDLTAADELGYRIKLLGVAQRKESGIEQRVHPTMVPRDSDIAASPGSQCRRRGGRLYRLRDAVRTGRRRRATASAVVSDIIDLARGVACRRSAACGEPAALPQRRSRRTRAAITCG